MKWKVFWSPEGRCIATVEAKTARAAKRKAPMPYRKYLGEIYVVEAPSETSCCQGWTTHDITCVKYGQAK